MRFAWEAVEGISPRCSAAHLVFPPPGVARGVPVQLASLPAALARRRVSLHRSRRSAASRSRHGSGPVPPPHPPVAPGGAGSAAVTRARSYKVPAPAAAAAERGWIEPGAGERPGAVPRRDETSLNLEPAAAMGPRRR